MTISCLIPEIELLGAPKGRRRTAQGVSPGNTYGNNVSPERAKQLVSVLKEQFCVALSGLCNLYPKPRAYALGCPAGPLRGPYLSAIRDCHLTSPHNFTPIGTIFQEIR